MSYSEEVSFYYGADRKVKGLVAVVLLLASVGWLGAHIMGFMAPVLTLCGIVVVLALLVRRTKSLVEGQR